MSRPSSRSNDTRSKTSTRSVANYAWECVCRFINHSSLGLLTNFFYWLSRECFSRGSSVDIATGYGLDEWAVGVRGPVRQRIFTSPYRPDQPWDPSNLLSSGYRGRGLSPGGKRQGLEAYHSPPSSVEVNRTWIYTTTAPSPFVAWAQGQLYSLYVPSVARSRKCSVDKVDFSLISFIDICSVVGQIKGTRWNIEQARIDRQMIFSLQVTNFTAEVSQPAFAGF
jgi:hypothetical protein